MGKTFLIAKRGGKILQIPLVKMDIEEVAYNAAIDIADYDLNELNMGMDEESEHVDVTGGDPVTTLKIVVAHLEEDPQYYTKLKSVM